jgi:transcriptional regulator with XRE-family HTH domain
MNELGKKIAAKRKDLGMTQIEFAERLCVTRQTVSRWEAGTVLPDIDKISDIAKLLDVSCDYLLRDDIVIADTDETAPVDRGLEDTVRSVSMEDASSFLEHNERAASRISTGVMMCILSPVLLIVVAGLAEAGFISLSGAAAEAGGTAILIIIVAIAVGLFIMEGMRGKPYEYLDNTAIDTEYGVSGMVRERRDGYAEKHTRLLILGIMMCIIGAVPMLIMEMTRYSNNTDLLPVIGVAAMLIIVAAGVKLIVLTCIRQGGYDRLLEEGDYTRLNKKAGKYDGIYWAVATAVYLGWSFVTMRWEITWIVWPVAGVLFAAYREVMKAICR